jgi:hypothetical protein
LPRERADGKRDDQPEAKDSTYRSDTSVNKIYSFQEKVPFSRWTSRFAGTVWPLSEGDWTLEAVVGEIKVTRQFKVLRD